MSIMPDTSGLEVLDFNKVFDCQDNYLKGITTPFSGRIKKEAYPRKNELPIALFEEVTAESGERVHHIIFPHRRLRFAIGHNVDAIYSGVWRFFGRVPVKNKKDAYFMLSSGGNMKATIHRSNAHFGFSGHSVHTMGSRHLSEMTFSPLKRFPQTSIIQLMFPHFGLPNKSVQHVVKDGQKLTLLSPPKQGEAVIVDLSLHEFPFHDVYNINNGKLIALSTDYIDRVAIVIASHIRLADYGIERHQDAIMADIERAGRPSKNSSIWKGGPAEALFDGRANIDQPIRITWVGNFEKLVREVYPE